jgi:glycerol-3-phosphate dehydrogenase (NAD+)
MAAYITRSSLELQGLCKAMGGEPQTISGLSGVGDLILTCFGSLSRNRTLGIKLSKGEKLEDVTSQMTVEGTDSILFPSHCLIDMMMIVGVPTAKVAIEFARRCGLDLPIFTAVHAILNGQLKIEDAHVHLMGRPAHLEFSYPVNS